MAEKLISNPGQAFSLGASWGTPSFDNAMTTENADLINSTGLTLYVGDIVCMDASGTEAILSAAAGDATVIGCVGDPRHQATESPLLTSGSTSVNSIGWPANAGGGFTPFVDSATSTVTVGYTNGSANATSASTASTNPLYVGAYVAPPTSAYATVANTQIFQVASNGGSSGAWTAVLTVVSGPGTTFQGTTGSYASTVGDSAQAVGPGWRPAAGWTSASTFPPGVVVPVTIRGYGRVNINGLTTVVRGSFITPTNASVVGAVVLQGAATAAQTGQFIATALEAYSARDVSLTNAGITGHDSVRAIIGKF